jgi:hypothetical protein
VDKEYELTKDMWKTSWRKVSVMKLKETGACCDPTRRRYVVDRDDIDVDGRRQSDCRRIKPVAAGARLLD